MVKLSSDDSIEIEGDSKARDRSDDEDDDTTLDEIVVATRGEHTLGVKSTFQIAATTTVACCEATAAQKAFKRPQRSLPWL